MGKLHNFDFFCNKERQQVDYYIDVESQAILTAFGRLAGDFEEIRLQAVDWQLIVKKHGPAVWQTVYRLLGNETDAADCFQETFLCALEVARRQHVRSFSALLARLAASRAINRLRQRIRQSQRTNNQAQLSNVAVANPGPVRQAEGRELVLKLREALGQIPAQEAEVFCLRYLNNMSYRQIARELGIKASSAGVLLHRARMKLSDILKLKNEVSE